MKELSAWVFYEVWNQLQLLIPTTKDKNDLVAV